MVIHSLSIKVASATLPPSLDLMCLKALEFGLVTSDISMLVAG